MRFNVFFITCFFLLSINILWAEGASDNSSRIHPGAKMILMENGYRFDFEGNLIGYKDFSITRFPNENDTNTNPHSYNKNVIYVTNFNADQWLGKNIFGTTGNAAARYTTRAIMGNLGTITGTTTSMYGTRIYVQDIPDIYLREIKTDVRNAFLIYTGVQSFQMANGSTQVFPVFLLFDLFDMTITKAMSQFNQFFDKGIYKVEDDYEYSKLLGRTIARDRATRNEFMEWNGNQWIPFR